MKLGERLAAIAQMVLPGATIADIGTDHAYLPVELIRRGKVSRAIAGDIHEGPYQAATVTVKEAGLSKQISVRLGDGLAVLEPGEVDTVILAGMGGSTMIQILAAQGNVTASLKQIILQPMNGAALLREWLHKQKWLFVEETLVEEEGHLYEIIRVMKQSEQMERAVQPLKPILYEVGPLLWHNKPPLLSRHLLLKIHSLEGVLEQLKRSTSLAAAQKSKFYRGKLDELREMMACL
ncbi:tRNA (adenine(22)-N(1))-methyltransferase [Pelorhabdus rhamnosifermentans]|uniref:tRNA (adenine(22)-N(1))-methyltransferase n=1 Tax=Pelorhabdus rhamnosifermentans TaxID=2772457 RepID=UPI001C05F3D9|nr:class I SAM-dependent methyltransferase [Pelorhabdus rhamnosifermentans]